MEKVEGFYQVRAKELVDMLFDKGYFREDISRDGMKAVEDFIGFLFQSQCQMAARAATLLKKVKERNKS